jgi:hypothetical protein
MGCYPPGLSAIFWCTCFLPSLCFFSSVPFLLLTSRTGRLSRSSVFSMCRPPVAATLRPRSVCAHNRSLHVVPAAAHCSGARKRVAQEPEDHRFSTPDPIGPLPRPPCPPHGVRYATNRRYLYYALLVFIFDAPVPPRRTDFHPHIPSSPYDTRPYRLCPVCSGPPTSTLLADTFVCQRSWGCQQSTAACSCLPVRERPLRASPD